MVSAGDFKNGLTIHMENKILNIITACIAW